MLAQNMSREIEMYDMFVIMIQLQYVCVYGAYLILIRSVRLRICVYGCAFSRTTYAEWVEFFSS